jgi:hypothetical protein
MAAPSQGLGTTVAVGRRGDEGRRSCAAAPAGFASRGAAQQGDEDPHDSQEENDDRGDDQPDADPV